MILLYHNTKIELSDKKARQIALENGWTELVDNAAYNENAEKDSPQAQNPKQLPNSQTYFDFTTKLIKQKLDEIVENAKKQWQSGQ